MMSLTKGPFEAQIHVSIPPHQYVMVTTVDVDMYDGDNMYFIHIKSGCVCNRRKLTVSVFFSFVCFVCFLDVMYVC